MKFKKITVFALAAAMCFGCFALVACGNNSEQVIREDITTYFDRYKDQVDEATAEIATMARTQGLDQMGVDPDEFAASLLEGFDYTLDGIEINGDKATATVTIVSKSYADLEQKLEEAYNEFTDPSMLQSYAGMTEDQLYDMIGDKLMEALDNTKVDSTTATVVYDKTGNVWNVNQSESTLWTVDSALFQN